LLARADVITSNGPSCTRLLKSYGAEDEKIMPWDYAADPRKIYADQIPDRKSDQAWNILTVGQLSQRKGMLPAAKELARWATDNPNVQVQWNIVGTGPLADELQSVPRPDNLHLLMHGHRSPDQIAHDYRNNDVLLFPTLADEWGLVVDEALHSGLPVIGSVHSQASQTLIDMGGNGWTYDPDHSLELSSILDQVQALTADQYQRMTRSARQSVQLRTPETSARQLVEAIVTAVSP
jgi:glycosyltransferase involved in cell wall biosynthesis